AGRASVRVHPEQCCQKCKRLQKQTLATIWSYEVWQDGQQWMQPFDCEYVRFACCTAEAQFA
ncbi:hypothetical protein, partial [Bacillus sp. SIMBA_005]|uniref:hypothetical protein n=1 Tax=Bacillus sp. SIMBA_005 TaxID=3085754 RepID=UPI00397CBCA4